jgi:hypothetical protein
MLVVVVDVLILAITLEQVEPVAVVLVENMAFLTVLRELQILEAVAVEAAMLEVGLLTLALVVLVLLF